MFLSDTLFRTAQQAGDRCSMSHEGRDLTWNETLFRVRCLADALVRRARSGMRCVVVLGLSGPEYFELSFAIPMAGLVFVPINVRMSDQELAALVPQLDVAAVVYDTRFQAQVDRLPLQPDCPRIVWGAGDGEIGYERVIATSAPADPVLAGHDADWGIIFTGGTTGLPKGVVLSHRAIMFNVLSILTDIPWETGCRFLQVSPLFHLAGLGPSFAVTALCGTHFFLPQFSIDGLLTSLSSTRSSCTNLVPTMINWMLAAPDRASHDLSSLRSLAYGASSISAPVLERLMSLYPDLTFTQFYGQTESCGGLTSLLPAHHSLEASGVHRLRSAGRPVFGAHVAILDESGAELPRGVWGEICGRSPGLFTRYLGHPELTEETKRGGWLRTGDIGYMDDEGLVYVTDRLKDMIVTGGENVSSSEVEAAIARYEGVRQVSVVAAPDAEWGERVHAFVVVDEIATFDPEAMKTFCRTHIAGYKVPKTVTVLTAPLPTSAVGKVRKDMLRAMIGDC